MRRFNPVVEALAFRIWAYATPLGWNCTILEIAGALDVSAHRVSGTCIAKGWLHRLRNSKRVEDMERHQNGVSVDRMGMGGPEILDEVFGSVT